MKLRLALLVLSAFLSLAISADRISTNCRKAWSPSSNSQNLTDGLGVNIHFTDPQPGEVKMIADAGFRWVRMDFKWEVTEHERGHYDFSEYDRLIAALEPFHIRALFILDYGNPLYDGAPPRTEAAREAFARWAVAAARHFSGRGVIWEMYNEPNWKMFWPPRPNVDEYIPLALTVGRAFRNGAPSEKLIGPATAAIDLPFLEACFKAGLLDYWSAVSVHPYRQPDPETVANEYCRLRETIQSYARYRTGSDSDRVSPTSLSTSDKVVPIISGEWGFSSAWRGLSDEKQGALLAREMLTNVANGIPISIWYDWRDDGVAPDDPEAHFGLVRNAYRPGRDQVYEPKPAYLAAKTFSDYFNGYRFEKRLPIGSDNDYVLVFSKAGERRIAAWTTSPTARRIVIPLGAGRFAVVKHTGENAGSVSANQQGLAIQISTTPIYLLPSN